MSNYDFLLRKSSIALTASGYPLGQFLGLIDGLCGFLTQNSRLYPLNPLT